MSDLLPPTMPDDLDALIQARADKVRASVSHREPVAWAVMLPDGDRIYDVYAIEEEAKAIDEAVTGNHGVVPLCRSPTLTDAEREAVQFAAFLYEQGGRADDAATLRGLLERLK